MDEGKPGPKIITNAFGYVDEVGLLHTPKEDKIFGLGLLKMKSIIQLHRAIVNYRNKTKFHSEFKFSEVSEKTLPYYKGFIDLFFSVPFTYFSCIIFDKSKLDIESVFKNNYYKAYNAFVSKLIVTSLDVSENIVILADDVNTPKSDNYEKEVREKVKNKARRNALFRICRIESKAVSEIQMVDIFLGAVAYSFKIKLGLIKPKRNAKFRLMKHLQKHLNTDKLSKDKIYELRFGRDFIVREFNGNVVKKIDSALGQTANKGEPTHSV